MFAQSRIQSNTRQKIGGSLTQNDSDGEELLIGSLMDVLQSAVLAKR